MAKTTKICKGCNVREKKKGSGVYHAFYNHGGQRAHRRVGSYAEAVTYAEAFRQDFLADPAGFIANLQRKPAAPVVPNFKEAAEAWVENILKKPRNKGGLAESSIERYEQMLADYVYPVIGPKRLDKITPQVYVDLLEKYRDQMSISAIGVINRVVSGAIMYAVSKGRVTMADPTSGITKALGLVRDKKKESARTVKALNQKQVELYLDTCAAHEPYYYPLMAFYYNTGTRMGEAAGLTWDNVDFDTGMVTFNKAIRKGRMGMMKTRRQRTVEVAPEIMTMLRTLQARQKEVGTFRIKGPVFLSKSGNPMPQSTIDNVNRRIIKKSGLPYINPHVSRHTFITEQRRQGARLDDLSEYVGHFDTRETQLTYSHLEEKVRPTNAVFLGSDQNGKSQRMKKNTTKESGDKKVTKLERRA